MDNTPVCKTIKPIESPDVVIFVTGHGVLFTDKGEAIEPSRDEILSNQHRLILKWSEALGDPIPSYCYEGDPVLENFHHIDALLTRAKIEKVGLYVSDSFVNRVMDSQYRRRILKQDPNEKGLNRIGALSTSNSGSDYIEECVQNGVPVPDVVLNGQWKNHGVLKDDFLGAGRESELWSWESSNPDGVCVALPRWNDENLAELFGIVCLGRVTNKVCFFDNKNRHPNYDPFFADRNNPGYGIENFLGGFELDENEGGMCSDCHGGENPFIVHPNDSAFIALKSAVSINSNAWPEPIVHPDWYQNPYPIPVSQFPAVNSGSCTQCHNGASGTRFPILSTATPGYCGKVLGNAVAPKGTMPSNGEDPALYQSHIRFLKRRCDGDPIRKVPATTETDDIPNNDPTFLSPPILVGPFYQCTNSVHVKGAVPGATVDILIDGQIEASELIWNSKGQSITLPTLSEGEWITAIQRISNVSSSSSFPVRVRDHSVDYPNGLPAPSIGIVHECGESVGVHHIPGATIDISKNGASTFQFTAEAYKRTSVGWGGPYVIGDLFIAKQSICGDESSPSQQESALPAPSPMPKVRIPNIYEDQEEFRFTQISQGAVVDVDATAGQYNFTWAWSRFLWNHKKQFGQPYALGDSLDVRQTLCTTSMPADIPAPIACGNVPAPKVIPPIEGENFISIFNHVAGARVRVYDAADVEIGDGGGRTILLKRQLVAGESLRVVQDLTECKGTIATQITVKAGKGYPIKEE